MLSGVHYTAVLNYFYFLLLDEGRALSAAFRVVQRAQKRKGELADITLEHLLIREMHLVFKIYKSKKTLPLTHPPKSDWGVSDEMVLAAWREYVRRNDDENAEVLVLKYILGFDTAVIAKAMGLPDGTILFRLGKGLESMSNSTLIEAERP